MYGAACMVNMCRLGICESEVRLFDAQYSEVKGQSEAGWPYRAGSMVLNLYGNVQV